jgi:hypothetical protein
MALSVLNHVKMPCLPRNSLSRRQASPRESRSFGLCLSEATALYQIAVFVQQIFMTQPRSIALELLSLHGETLRQLLRKTASPQHWKALRY